VNDSQSKEEVPIHMVATPHTINNELNIFANHAGAFRLSWKKLGMISQTWSDKE